MKLQLCMSCEKLWRRKLLINISFLGRTQVVTNPSEKSFVTCFLFLTGLSFHLRHSVNSEEADSVEKKKIVVNKVKICIYYSSVLLLSYSQQRPLCLTSVNKLTGFDCRYCPAIALHDSLLLYWNYHDWVKSFYCSFKIFPRF